MREFLKEIYTKAPDTLQSTDGMWAIASCQCVDNDKDIVMTDGIDLSYHMPPDRYMKLLTGHKTGLDSGEPPVIGRVEEFKRIEIPVNSALYPALAFRFSWAKNTDGQYTELAKKFKELYDSGYMESFSVGFSAQKDDLEQNEQGGLTIKKSKLHEISCVSIAANDSATLLKIKGIMGADFDYLRAKEDTDMSDTIGKAVASFLSASLENLNNKLEKMHDDFTARMDVLESAIVVLTHSAASGEGTQKDKEANSLKSVEKSVGNLLKLLDR